MLIAIPDGLRAEAIKSPPERLAALVQASRQELFGGLPVAEIGQNAERTGWSREMSEWIASVQAQSQGSAEIALTEQPLSEIAGLARSRKKSLKVKGWILAVASIVFGTGAQMARLAAMPMDLSQGQDPGSLALAAVFALVALGTYIAAVCLLLQSKARRFDLVHGALSLCCFPGTFLWIATDADHWIIEDSGPYAVTEAPAWPKRYLFVSETR